MTARPSLGLHMPVALRLPGLRWPWQVAAAGAVGGLAGLLVAGGAWYLVAGLLVAVPVLVLVHRQPMAALALWVVLTPLVVVTDSMVVRMVFWLVHRLLPLALLLLLVVVRPQLYGRVRPLGRLGGPDLVAVGYVAVTIVSILLTADEAVATVILAYDRVIAPVLLYVAVRLLRPSREEVARWLVPAILVMLVVQVVVGMVSWSLPGALPAAWATKVGARTTGTLQSVSVYGVAVILGGLVALHTAATTRVPMQRARAMALFALATLMVFLTFSRGSWMAGALAIGGALVLHRALVGRVALVVAVSTGILLGSGLLAGQLQLAEQRIASEQASESALSRLPVAVASIRMFQERPLTGWGYEQFNEYDRQFQSSVAGFHPEKDQSSHNLYLRVLAEQGLTGLVLLLGPTAWWLLRWVSLRRSGRLRGEPASWTAVLWLALLAHVVVNNLSNMQVPFGLGLWWLTLAVIATTVQQAARSRPAPTHRPRPTWSPV